MLKSTQISDFLIWVIYLKNPRNEIGIPSSILVQVHTMGIIILRLQPKPAVRKEWLRTTQYSIDIPETKNDPALASPASQVNAEWQRDLLQILPISQIQESSCIQISTFKTPLHLGLDAIALLVLPPKKEAQYSDKCRFDQVGDYHGPDSKLIGRPGALSLDIFTIFCMTGANVRLIRLIEERPGDITSTISEEQNSVGDDLFGVS